MKKGSTKKAVLDFIATRKKVRWSEIRDSLQIPKPTLNHVLSQLRKENLVKPIRDTDDKKYYYIWDVGNKLDMILKGLEKNNEKLKFLKKLGLFSKGMTEKDIMTYLKRYPGFLESEQKLIAESKELTLHLYSIFERETAFVISFDINTTMKIKMKIHADPDKEIRFTEKRLKEIPNEFDEKMRPIKKKS